MPAHCIALLPLPVRICQRDSQYVRREKSCPGEEVSHATAVPATGPSGILQSALVGMIFGVDAAGHCLALATICFGGVLASGLGLTTGRFLFGSLIATVVLFRFSRLPVALGVSQDTAISILAPAVILTRSVPDRDLAALLLSIFGRSVGAKLALIKELLTYANPAAADPVPII